MNEYIWRQRIGIFYLSREWAEQKFDEIINELPQEYICLIRRSKYDMIIKFFDGSYIRFIQANEKSKCQKFDKIFYQSNISDDLVNILIRPLWTPIRPMGIG